MWDWVTRAEGPQEPLTVAQSDHWSQDTMVAFFKDKAEDAAARAAKRVKSKAKGKAMSRKGERAGPLVKELERTTALQFLRALDNALR